MAKYGRHADALKIMPGLMAIPGQDAAGGTGSLRRSCRNWSIPWSGWAPWRTISAISRPIRSTGPCRSRRSAECTAARRIFLDIARRDNLTIRQLYLSVAGGNGHRTVIGTPADIADAMEEWFHREAADGFNILPPWLPGGLEEVVDMVVPELQRRGLYRTAYEGSTLRENLGIPYAAFGKVAYQPAAE